MDLTSSRPTGFGEGAIGWSTINDYCIANGIVDEQREDVFYHITHMDAAYLDYKTKKAAKKQEAESKKTRKK